VKSDPADAEAERPAEDAAPAAKPEPPRAPPAPPAGDAPLSPEEARRLKRRAQLGVLVFIGRTAILEVGVFLANIALARLLSPGDFGMFAIVQFALSFFNFFGDVGLGGALIRQKEEPTQRELSSVFFFQIGVALVMMTLIGGASFFLRRVWSDLPETAVWIMRALAVDMLLTAFRIVPSILLERDLDFGRIGALEVIVKLSFLVTALVLAALGFGVWALAISALTQGVVSLIGAYVLRPWRPSLVFDSARLKPIVRFGLTFQTKNLIGFVNGSITPVYAGAMLGPTAVGYIGWAQGLAYFPLKLVEIMARVNFPLYARIHGDRKLFSETLGQSIQVCGMVTLFFVALFFGMGPNVVRIIYAEKWLPALPLLYLYAGAISIGFLSPIVGAALDASGRPGIIARLALGWTTLNWVVVLLATPRWGMIGFSAGYIVHVIVGNLAVVLILRKLIPEAVIWPRVRASILAAAVTAALGHFVLSPWATTPLSFVASVLACIAVFLVVLAVVDRSALEDALALIRPKRGASAGRPAASS
jgi:PST family polysaccharide transporter